MDTDDSSESDEEVLLQNVPPCSSTEAPTELGSPVDHAGAKQQGGSTGQQLPGSSRRHASCSDQGRVRTHEATGKSNRPIIIPRQSVRQGVSSFTVFPRRYDGTGDWQSYKLHFLSCAESNAWSDDDSCRYLKTRLEGDAALVLPQVRNCSFNALLTALDTRYGIAAPEFVTKARLRDIFQQEGQSLRAYADKLTKHVGIKPGSESVEERIVLEQFLHGILDVKVRRYVNKRNPVSIDDAIRLGRECEEVRDWMSESVDQAGVDKIHDLESEVASLKQEVLRLSGAPRMRSEEHHDSDTIAAQRMRPRVPRLIDKQSTASCAPRLSSTTGDIVSV